MAPEERRVLREAHSTLATALVAIADRAGLSDQATVVARRLGMPGVEGDPVALVALHSEALALIAEALRVDAMAPEDCARRRSRPPRWWS